MTEVVADGVTVRRGTRTLLDRVGLTLRPGELVGIVGPNGAGKSTLLRALTGSLVPEAGAIRVAGRDLGDLTGIKRTRLIGYVPQRFEPAWNYSVREVLEMGASRAPPTAGAREATIEENELTSLLDRRWSSLSGGERARVLLASVLITRPPILLADEPGASLDIRHRYALLARLRAYAATGTVAIVLHELDLALRFCDRLVVLSDGRVALDAPVTEAAHSAVLDAVFGVAFQRIPVGSGRAVPLAISTSS